MRTALTIAGSDSGGGAGIQADLKTFAVHGVFGASALTAITAQNTAGVARVMALPPDMVLAQIDAVLTDIGANVIKVGMLATADIARAVAVRLDASPGIPVVLDPVMIAKGGTHLLDTDAISVLRTEWLPRATVVTANAPEAAALTGLTVSSEDDLVRAAAALVALGAHAAFVKGGHLDGPATDILHDGRTHIRFSSPRLPTRHTHGTGCTLAAALAARLALGDDLRTAAARAKHYVTWAIAHAPGLGHGHGPLGWGLEGLGLH